MNDPCLRDDILRKVWQACRSFRGAIDPTQGRDYILTLLFVKYLNDIYEFIRDACEKKYNGDPVRIERALGRERFIVPRIEIRDQNDKLKEAFPATYRSLYDRRTRPNIGELVNMLLARIEDANKVKLHNVFRNIDFNSEAKLGPTLRRNTRLKNLLEALGGLDLSPESADSMDVVGDLFEGLIEKFAATTDKKSGDFYTPAAVSETLARLAAPRPGDRISDPACGSGSLLIRAGKQVGSDDYALYGQELIGDTWTLCKMNMFLHGLDAARIEWGDSLRHPQFVDESGNLMKFDIVISNPPFGLDKWGQEIAAGDRFGRFQRGIPPKSKGDWAFISHMLAIAAEGSGRVGVVAPHGVLFRGGQEGRIREAAIRENLLDAVIGLPANLFFGTPIPAVLLIFDKSRPDRGEGGVLFIDASREFEQGARRNHLRPRDIEKIVTTCHNRRILEGYSRLVSSRELRENGFDLNMPRYVDTFESGPEIDIPAVQEEIGAIEKELAGIRKKMKDGLKALGAAGKSGVSCRIG